MDRFLKWCAVVGFAVLPIAAGVALCKGVTAFERSRNRRYVETHLCRHVGEWPAEEVVQFGFIVRVGESHIYECENPHISVDVDGPRVDSEASR